MWYFGQFCRILVISFVAEILHQVLPLPVPASIYGILLLFLLLETGILRLEKVSDAGKFLITIMPVMFIPAAVGLMESYDLIRSDLFAYSIMTIATTVIVMAVSGVVTQVVIRKGNGGDQE